jgi:DNA-binding Lrp family transcriptional regulator
MAGYILLHRSLLTNWVWEERIFSKAEAWIDLIFLVNFADGTHKINNEIRPVPRGSRYITLRDLADRWKWSTKKVTNFLRLLEDDGMITLQKRNTEKTMLTVVNWDFYQLKESEEKTRKKQERNREETLNNKGKEGNKEKEITSPVDFDSFWEIYPRKEAKATALKKWIARINEGETPENMITGATNYAAACKAKGTETKYIKLPSTFIGPDKHYMDHLIAEPATDILQTMFPGDIFPQFEE